MSQGRFVDRFRYFRGEPQQVSGSSMLYDAIAAGWGPEQLLIEEADWARRFSETPPPPPPGAPLNPLPVPHFWQRDNSSGQGDRECFSSSIAMILAFYDKVDSDDEYNAIRQRFGDTTNAAAHIGAVRHLGMTPAFLQNGRDADLDREIQAGRPVAVGWLHHGHVSRPSGGGHYSTIIGTEGTDRWIVHDPFGQPDLVNGGWISQQRNCGQSLRFTRANFGRRWAVEGQGSGWYFTIRP
jgi:hypothetical protein